MSTYSTFAVPSELAVKPVSEWTEAEARRYLVWLRSTMDERVAGLLSFLGEPESQDRTLLERVGEKATWVLRSLPFTLEGRPSELNEAGYALAADLGLLVAQRLCRRLPHLAWEVVRKPMRDPSYNQPVLKGFGSMHLDPVRGSVAEAMRAARGEATGNAWLRIYDHWLARGLAHSGTKTTREPKP